MKETRFHFQTRDKRLNAICPQQPADRTTHSYAALTQVGVAAGQAHAARTSQDWQRWQGDLLRRTYSANDSTRFETDSLGTCVVYCFPNGDARDAFCKSTGSVAATLVRILPGGG